MLLLSLLRFKCPKCREGNLFIEPNPYQLAMLSKMPKHCKCCGQATEPEPGFYFGAMYVSYALGVVMFAILFVLVEFILQIKGYHFMWIYSLVMILLWPILFRLSRVIYLYFFISYDKNAKNRNNN